MRSGGLNFLGAPFSYGQEDRGPSIAPQYFRQSPILRNLDSVGVPISDFGDLKVKQAVTPENLEEVYTAYCSRLSQEMYEALDNQNLSLVVGGDHSIAWGSISGVLRKFKSAGVIWVDAHGDINTRHSSPSGNLHGMPLSRILGIDGSKTEWCPESLPPERLVYFGVRDLDPSEKRIIEELEIKLISPEEIQKKGTATALVEAIDYLKQNGSTHFHLSLDVDVIDPEFFDSTGLNVPNGLSPEDLVAITKILKQTRRWTSMDLVEINPLIGRLAQKGMHSQCHRVLESILSFSTHSP